MDSDGRCVYTDCFAGDKDPVDCFGCSGNDCDNGCGPEPSSMLNWLQNAAIPESVGTIFDFSGACCNHDWCYASTAFDQATCDTQLKNEALASCAPEESDWAIVRWLRKSPVNMARRFQCELAAHLYYLAVDQLGETPYNDGQAVTEAWEASPSCAAPCPTTQTSGGKGGTTLRIDMKGRTGRFDLSYQMYSIQDSLVVRYGPDAGSGDVLFTTGGLVSGGRRTTAMMPADGTSSIVTAVVFAPEDGTLWDISIGCPENEPGSAP